MVNKRPAHNNKSRIIAAALEVFAERGKFGARMDEIAHRAGVNKALVYYFYSSRENLYRCVLDAVVDRIMHHVVSRAARLMAETSDPVTRIRTLAAVHFDTFARNANHTKILLEAVASNPEEIRAAIVRLRARKTGSTASTHTAALLIKEGVSRGIFRAVDPTQVILSIIGMNLFYFISKPISQVMLDIDVGSEAHFLKQRKESIIDLLLHGILKEKEH